jgi:hypothetical protein
MAMPPFPDLMNIVAFRDLPAAIAAHIANFQEYLTSVTGVAPA